MPYLGKTPSQATRQRYYKTASGGETSISGTMTTGGTLTFNDGEFVDVSVNGVALVAGTDYNTNTANTIAGLSALSANDQVEIVVYDTFSVFSGDVDSNLSVGGNLSVTGTTALTGAATLTAGFTASDGCTITTADNSSQLTLVSTDADASVGPRFDLKRDSGSPADGDTLGRVRYMFDNDAAEQTEGVRLDAVIVDASDGTEDTKYQISTMVGGTLRNRIDVKEDSVVINQDAQDLDFRVESSNNTAMLAVDAGNDRVGIGTNSPDTMLHISAASSARLRLQDTTNNVKTDILVGDTSSVIGNVSSHNLEFMTSDTNRMTISSAGAIGINESSPSTFLHIDNGGANGSGQADAVRLHNPGTTAGDGAGIKFSAGSSTTGAAIFGTGQSLNSCNLVFRAGGDTERMRIDTGGNLTIPGGDSSPQDNSSGNGLCFTANGEIRAAVGSSQVADFNRMGNDGTVIMIRQAGTAEGSIEVNGSTVSLNGGHLSRWSQTTDGQRISGLLRGTVMTNLDQMAVWHHDAVEAQDAGVDDDGNITEAVKARDAYTEDNEQLNCTAVSSVEGDPNVAGVFQSWDESDDFNDMTIAMTGDFIIRIAKDTTVARGDLLMSAGDGTAKPQDDDIVRSKTIAKVTSTTKSHTYDDGSYLVPCVLMAC